MTTVIDLTGVDQLLDLADPEIHAALIALAEKVAARGGGIAVYENHELGHPGLGHRQFVTFGHPDAQIETISPPLALPDIGGAINWRYTIIATLNP
jgi:hypothetical protein